MTLICIDGMIVIYMVHVTDIAVGTAGIREVEISRNSSGMILIGRLTIQRVLTAKNAFQRFKHMRRKNKRKKNTFQRFNAFKRSVFNAFKRRCQRVDSSRNRGEINASCTVL